MNLYGQDTSLKIFLDCKECKDDYIATRIAPMQLVRERAAADIHIQTGWQRTGSGSRITLWFEGLDDFAGVDDTIQFLTYSSETDRERLDKQLRYLLIGLVPYMRVAGLTHYLHLEVANGEEEHLGSVPADDPWNGWIYRIGARGSGSGESNAGESRLRGGLNAKHIGEFWKFELDFDAHFDHSFWKFTEDDGTDITERTDVDNYEIEIRLAYALNDHWTVGIFAGGRSNTYRNIDYNVGIAPAIEYNFLPFSESSEHSIRVEYSMTPAFTRYLETTLFLNDSETLLLHALSLNAWAMYHWGNLEGGIMGNWYQHDPSKNQIGVYGHASVQVTVGLEFNIYASYAQIHDQLHLPAESADLTDILTQRKDIATSFEYGIGMGLSYTFGSIYRSTVNNRFGGF